jgi:GNAT superfamily N-acetyltransferase
MKEEGSGKREVGSLRASEGGAQRDAVVDRPQSDFPRVSVAASRLGAVSVRRATYADLPIVVELRLALLRENVNHAVYGHLRPDARERAYDVFASQLRSPNEVMFLADRAGDTVGIMRCVDTPNSPLLYPDRYCYISSVYVRPTARRRGILKALLKSATVWCHERGLAEMRLHNIPEGVASAAWKAEGFEMIEEVRWKGVAADT